MKKRKRWRKQAFSMLSLCMAFAIVFTSSVGYWGKDLTVYAEGEATALSLKFNQEYATVGEPLTVTLEGLRPDAECTYQWKVGGSIKSGTGASYVPVQADLEKLLTVTATVSGAGAGTYQASMYLSKLPVLYVETEGRQEITSKETYIQGDFRIQGNAEYNSTNTTLYDGAIQIRGRGNSTWQNPKKPYKVKLDEKTDLFGFGKNKHWVLLANYTDESHMRNIISYNLSGEMGMPYMQSVHVDLVMNGTYRGTYQFCEQVKIAGDRVDIHDWEDYAGDVAKAVYKAEQENGLTKDDQDGIEDQLAEKDLSWMRTKKFNYKGKEYNIEDYLSDMPEATGGFLVELDAYFDEYSKFKSGKNQPIQFKNPEFIATDPTSMNYVKDYINAFETAAFADDFTTNYNGEDKTYSQLFDMDSLLQFWLVNELFMNVDAMKKSTYMYKGVDGLFHMGPIWDMDWSSNSLVSQGEGSGTYDAWQTVKYSAEAQASQWYKPIIKDPYFAVQAYGLYTKMREELGSIVANGGKIDSYNNLLLESANANAEKWYSWDMNKGFSKQSDVLKTYLNNRIQWLDRQFQSPQALASSLGYQSAGGISVQPEDIVAQESGTTTVTANVTNQTVQSVEFLVNGKNIGTKQVSDGKATVEIPTDLLMDEESYNTVQVFGVKADGSVIQSFGKKVTDYEVFYAEKPDKPVDPDDPDKPVDPDDPDKPVDPDDPDKPVDPDDPDKPVDPDDPDKPVDPDDPDKPVDPDDPDKPVDPDDPDKPVDPDDPDKPVDPDDPDKPVDPDDPDKPIDPDDPDKPVDPDVPEKPVDPMPDPVMPVAPKPPAVGKILTDQKGKAQYKVTKSGSKNGTVEYVKNKASKASSISVPATVTIDTIKYKVTSISAKAFQGNKKLERISIGSNVKTIKGGTFRGCSKLKKVSIGKDVTSIGDKAFYQCTALGSVAIPGKVAKIEKQTFYGCKKLTKAVIPASVKSIGSKAFASCPKLKAVVIKTTKLTSKNTGSKVFQGINSKAVVKVPAKKLKSYKALLNKRGITGKNQKVKR